MTHKLQPSDTGQETISKLADGNLGALTVLMQMMDNHLEQAGDICYALDDMNIYGSRLWLAYQDYCNGYAYEFFRLVLNRNAGLIEFLNQEKFGFEDKVVESGDSKVFEKEGEQEEYYYEGLALKRA